MRSSTAERLLPDGDSKGAASRSLRIASRRLGEFEVSEERVFTLSRGLVGLPAARRFVLLDHRPGSLFRWLLCVDDPELAFVVADPSHLIAGYEPPIAAAAGALACDPAEVVVMVLLAFGGVGEVTANLLAPVVVDGRARSGCQLVLEGSGFDPAHRIEPGG